ncbi:S1 family peptidase [Microbacterium sp. Leaf161]|uniref:S1 family peptidase n=1 Tax=Microbacterium sp. Leaf161 TaxID=1736281 RepID=UPI0006FF7102|nr:S1 family peptidase [Microbacterium sp. Leaf161]
MKHRVTGRRALALTAATTIALSGLLVAGPAYAEDGAEPTPTPSSTATSETNAPVEDAPVEDAPPADLVKLADTAADHGVEFVASGTTAEGQEITLVSEDGATDDASIEAFAAEAQVPASSVVALGGTPQAFAEGDIVGGQGYLIVDQDDRLYNCSVGFAAWSPDRTPALLSAGHCAFDDTNRPMAGTLWSVPSEQPAAGGNDDLPATPEVLGTFGFAQFGSTDNAPGSDGDTNATDISVIDVVPGTNPLPFVTDWTTATEAYDSLAESGYAVKAVGAAVPGPVAKSGRTTGYTVGAINGNHIIDGWAQIEDRWVQGFSSNTEAGPGDSGGAVIQGNTAVGLISGGIEAEPGVEQWTWSASLTAALPKTGGYEVALDIDAPVITSPTDGAEVQPGTTVTGTAPGATEVTVSGFGADQTVAVTDGAFSFVGPVELGAQTITVTARNGLSTSDSTTIDVTVVPAPLVAPVITSPANDSRVNETVTEVSGTGLPTTTITVTDAKTDDVLGTTEVAGDGSWTVDGLSFEYGLDYSIVVTQTRDEEVSPEATSTFSVVPVSPAVTSVTNGAEFAHNDGPSGLAGTGIDGATVTVKLNGAEPTSANTAALAGAFAAASGTFTATVEDGAWSVDFGAALESGSYTVSATQAIDGVSSDPTDLSFAVLAAPVAGGGGAAAPGDGGLAVTGADLLVPLSAAAIALALLSGGLLLVFRRRQLIES